ncbi:SDR family oxidoreductase [Puia sp. P3]|uniref:SDR family oxidoreductase n=1 Tax=Puia sp. P3 TaxID=3423952 RepID=UPI003D66C44A
MKTVLITGANKGIGYETARQLLRLGHFVFLGSRDLQRGRNAVQQLKNEGLTRVELLSIDVADRESVGAAARELSSKTDRLDVLINNAGIAGQMPQNASAVALENIRRVFDTNFFGVIQTTQAFLPLLKKSGEPCIVNVSSDLGSLGNQTSADYPFADVKLTAYCSSKTALNAFTVMLAYEFRDTPFRINSVSPGYTATDLNQHRGHKSVEDGVVAVVKYALLDGSGPSGKFFGDEGETPW